MLVNAASKLVDISIYSSNRSACLAEQNPMPYWRDNCKNSIKKLYKDTNLGKL